MGTLFVAKITINSCLPLGYANLSKELWGNFRLVCNNITKVTKSERAGGKFPPARRLCLFIEDSCFWVWHHEVQAIQQVRVQCQ